MTPFSRVSALHTSLKKVIFSFMLCVSKTDGHKLIQMCGKWVSCSTTPIDYVGVFQVIVKSVKCLAVWRNHFTDLCGSGS